MTELKRCSMCKCNKLLSLFKVKLNTGLTLKTCISCNEKFECNICKSKFRSKPKLQLHINSVHLDIRNFQCDDCESKFHTNGHLQEHINSVHLDLRKFQCDDCESKFSLKSTLQKHINSVHLDLRNFQCDNCESKFHTNVELKIHVNVVHLDIRKFQCDDCESKFHTKTKLQEHINSVHLDIRNFQCDDCKSKFHTNGKLQRHIIICKKGILTNMSGLELRCKEALTKLGFNDGIDYIFNSSYSKLSDFCGKKLRPDFRFIRHKIFIELDGSQHFKPKTFGSNISIEQAELNFKITKEYDEIKNNFCLEFGYKMIRIPYTEIMNIFDILQVELTNILPHTR
jgi:uncharacterized protein YlaI